MEIIPLISDILIYLLGLLVIIVLVTVISKKLKKTPEEDPAEKHNAPDVPTSLEPENKKAPADNAPGQEKVKPEFKEPSKEEIKSEKKKKPDFLSSDAAIEPKNITIKPKVAPDDLFKVKEEKSESKRYKPRKNKPGRKSPPRFQILNDDIDTKEKDEEEENKNTEDDNK